MLEHALDRTQLAALESHIDACESCQQVAAAFAVGTPQAPVGGGDAAPRAERLAEPLADPLDAELERSLDGRYLIRSVLGQGGMGRVYLARDLVLGRQVALKVHRAGSGEQRLQREAMAMAKLAHPNVVTVFEVGTVGDRLFVAMEYVQGETLRGWLAARPRTWREIVAMLVAAGEGLAAAHAAGLVHRDFKPDNVLVGEDGRPRVSDFGLARIVGEMRPPGTDRAIDPSLEVRASAPTLAAGSEPPQARASAPTLEAAPMTESGAVLGTPAYMAPEQIAGTAVDARADQFAFCVVAWECLFGQRPFLASTLGALLLAIEAQQLAAPAGRDVPERVRRVLARGLAVEPAARYRDLGALLGALREGARPRTRRTIALVTAGVLALGGAALAGVLAASAHRREAACAREGDALRALAGADVQLVLHASFAATGSPLAAGAADRTVRVLARAADALGAQATAACHGRDEPPRVSAARRACLAARTSELRGLVAVLVRPDASLVHHAPAAAWGVFDPAPCDDPDLLVARPGAPTASAPAHVELLGRARALRGSGQYRESAELATTLLGQVRGAKDPELEIATLLLLGQVRGELDGPAQAAPLLHEVLALAEARGRDLDAALALDELATLAGVYAQDYAAAHRHVALALAKLARLGDGNPAIRGALLATEAQILLDENRLGEAEATMRRAIGELEEAYGADHPKLGAALGTLSQVLRAVGKTAESLAASERTLAILDAALGPDHPTVAGAHLNLAQALIDGGRFSEARAGLARADAVFERVFGADHPVRAAIAGNLGGLEQLQQNWDAALVAYRAALTILERTDGPGSAGASGARRDVARTLALQGRLDDAIREQARAIAILDALGADGVSRLVGALTELADLELSAGRGAQAVPPAERAVALGRTRPDDANPGELAAARFALARALGAAGGDLARARGLAASAAADHPVPERRAEIEAWLGALGR